MSNFSLPPLSRRWLCALLAMIGFACAANYPLQAAETSRVLIVVGPSNHPPGSHEVAAGGRLMKHCLEHSSNVPGIEVQVINRWPDASEREKASTIVFIGDTFPAGRFPNAKQNLTELGAMMQRGCGIVCVHYATGLLGEDVSNQGDHPLLEWMGGYFANRSCPHHESFAKIFEAATITPAADKHPICRGWKSFTIKDEPYTNNYFGKDGNRAAANVTVLATSMLPPENPKPECVAWCVERADQGRGFGIVMPHFYKNWTNADLRRFIMNGIVWTARLDVPANGVDTSAPDLKEFAPASVEPLPPKPKPSTGASTDANKNLLMPIWKSRVIHGESTVLLQETQDGPLVGRLAFPVKQFLSVQSSNRTKSFLQLDRIVIEATKGTISFPKNSDLPFIATQDLYLPPESPGSYRHRVGHPEQWLRFGPGKWFHDHQIEVTYEREDYQWRGDLPTLATDRLPKTLSKLRNGEPLKIGISGDSISTGLDASATSQSSPSQPGYAELLVDELKSKYKSDITLVNRAVAGWSVANGVADADALMANSPDLVIIAYGMNDVGRRDPEWFRKQTNELIERIQKARPDTEIILVATMLGNKEWIHTPRDMFSVYRDQLKQLRAPGVELADVGSVWEELLIRKHDLDLTGNGLNHPNDFGHRLYAQTIGALLISTSTSPTRD